MADDVVTTSSVRVESRVGVVTLRRHERRRQQWRRSVSHAPGWSPEPFGHDRRGDIPLGTSWASRASRETPGHRHNQRGDPVGSNITKGPYPVRPVSSKRVVREWACETGDFLPDRPARPRSSGTPCPTGAQICPKIVIRQPIQ